MPRLAGRSARCSSVLAIVSALVGVSCVGPASEPPVHCVTEDEMDAVIMARIDTARLDSFQRGEQERLEREDYLESRCYGINAYRRALGAD